MFNVNVNLATPQAGHVFQRLKNGVDKTDCSPVERLSASYISAKEYLTLNGLFPTGAVADTKMTRSPTGSMSQSLATLIAVSK